jgi:hypothetical protein
MDDNTVTDGNLDDTPLAADDDESKLMTKTASRVRCGCIY